MSLDRRDCRLRKPRAFRCLLPLLAICWIAAPAVAQEHAPAPSKQEHAQRPPTAAGAQAHAEPVEEHGEEHDDGGIVPLIAKVANFAILVGVLVYFLKSPIVAFLASRIATVKRDLEEAKEMRAAAEAQLGEIDRKSKALPEELEALKRQGAEDVRAEQSRMAEAAAAERQRLLEHTRREIEMRLRIARRELTAHAAELAVGVARQRISRTITPDDQMRLLDRYIGHLKEAR